MRNFYSYEERNQDRLEKRLTLGGLALVGLGAFLSIPSARKGLVREATEAVYKGASLLESKIGKGTLQNIRRGFGTDVSNIGLHNNSAGDKLKSFEALLGLDLGKQQARKVGIENLRSAGWSSQDAELIFSASNRSYDILSRRGTKEVLGHPYYREHILPKLSQEIRSSDNFLHQISNARREATQNFGGVSPDIYTKANKLFINQLRGKSRGDKVFAAFGVKRLNYADLVDHDFEKFLNEALHPNNIKFHEPSIINNWAFNSSLKNYAEEKGLSETQRTAAKLAFMAKASGQDNWKKVLSEISAEGVQVGGKAYNTGALKDFGKAGFDLLANELVIPIMPGKGGIMPLKLMPWMRGKSKDFAGSLGAGTFQREIFETLPEGLRTSLFHEDKTLRRDLYFVGKKIFGQTEEGDLLSIPSKYNKWEIRDARFGFNSEFAEIRSGATRTSGLRKWAGNSFLGKFMDKLSLGQQTDISEMERLVSAFGKKIFPDSDAYKSNPVNAFNRIMGGSNSVEDVEAVLYGVKKHFTVPKSVKASQIFEGALDPTFVPRGFQRLVEEDFSEQSMTKALREIDAISRGDESYVLDYFKDVDASMIRGIHTKINARRFNQNDLGTLVEGIYKESDKSIFNLEGLLGERKTIKGFDRLKEVFYDELFSQVAASRESHFHFSNIRNNVLALDRPTKEVQELGAGVWAFYNEKMLNRDFLEVEEFAESIAEKLRDPNNPLTPFLSKHLEKLHGGFTPWVTPAHLDTGGNLYAVPERLSLEGILFHSKGKSISEIGNNIFSSITRDTYSDMAGVNPGPIFHVGYRLNKMLSEFGLGLPNSDIDTGFKAIGNIALKRVAPVFLGVEAWKYLNFESNRILGTSPDQALGNLRAHASLVGSFIGDKLGLTGVAQRLVDLTPGMEDYWQPRSYEEKRDYLTSGYEPIRRGRFWAGGSRTAFVGDKIQYFSPTWYQLNQSNWQGAENVDWNTEDYWSHSWLPTPAHPLAPINKLLDPYWWENKHKRNRPYLISGPMFDESNIIGQALNVTLGRLLKPQIQLNDIPEGGQPSRLGDAQAYFTQSGAYEVRAKYLGKGGFGSGFGSGSGIGGGSGGGGSEDLYVRSNGFSSGNDDYYEDAINPQNLKYQGKNFFHKWYDIVGLYGWMHKEAEVSLGLLSEVEEEAIIASPGRATSYERRFWDRNLGGLGGNLSEFWRRVVPHKDNNLREYNPVPNNQPLWMPGSDYFINYMEGDPYTKTIRGEIRVPGDAYERIHGISSYDSATRVEILADLAPWSQEYKVALAEARADIEKAKISGKDNYAKSIQDRVNAALKRSSEQKKMFHSRPYRFNIETEESTEKVRGFIDSNTILVEGNDNPLRLAGVRLSNERIHKYIKEHNILVKAGEDPVTAFYRSFGVVPGSKVKAILSTKEDGQISDDILRTRRAAIIVNGRNINKMFLNSGVGVEKEEDTGPGIVARYSPSERFYGRLAEKLAHLDTVFHTKFWNVRSPLEQYKRTNIYGSNAGSWVHPISTYLIPTLDSITSKSPIISTFSGALLASYFFKSAPWKKGAAIGGAALGFLLSMKGKLAPGTYIPARVEKRREVEEYYDTLKYVKYTRLMEQYADEALQDEHVDILKIADEREEKGKQYKELVKQLEEKKRTIMLSSMEKKRKQEQLKKINARLRKEAEKNRIAVNIGPMAAKALQYRSLARRTLMGSKPGDPLDEAVGGLPKYERELAMSIITEGTAKEKKEFYSLLSKRQKAVLGYHLGQKPPKRESLEEYFQGHQLPNDEWKGWSEDFNLNDARIVSAKEEGVTPMEMYIFPRNEKDAEVNTREVPIPVIRGNTQDIERTLRTLLTGQGVRDISIQVDISDGDETRSDIHLDLFHDRTAEIAAAFSF